MNINGNHRFRKRNYKVCTQPNGTHLKQLHYWEEQERVEIIERLIAGKLLNGKPMTKTDYLKIIVEYDLYQRGLISNPRILVVTTRIFDPDNMPARLPIRKPI